jgi:hypothetical protein
MVTPPDLDVKGPFPSSQTERSLESGKYPAIFTLHPTIYRNPDKQAPRMVNISLLAGSRAEPAQRTRTFDRFLAPILS